MWALKDIIENLLYGEVKQNDKNLVEKFLKKHYSSYMGSFDNFGIKGYFVCTYDGLKIEDDNFKTLYFYSWNKLSKEYVYRRDNRQLDFFSYLK